MTAGSADQIEEGTGLNIFVSWRSFGRNDSILWYFENFAAAYQVIGSFIMKFRCDGLYLNNAATQEINDNVPNEWYTCPLLENQFVGEFDSGKVCSQLPKEKITQVKNFLLFLFLVMDVSEI